MKKILVALATVIGVLSCGGNGELPFYEPSNEEEQKVKQEELPFLGRATEKGEYQVAGFVGVTQDGDTINQNRLKGKAYVAEFFYVSCPDVCPLVKSQLVKMYHDEESFSEMNYVSFTLAPNQDTPLVLKKYAEDLGVDTKRWTFVNCEFRDVYILANSYLVAAVPERTENGEIQHDGRIVLVDGEGHLRATCKATDKKAMEMFKDQVRQFLKSND